MEKNNNKLVFSSNTAANYMKTICQEREYLIKKLN